MPLVRSNRLGLSPPILPGLWALGPQADWGRAGHRAVREVLSQRAPRAARDRKRRDRESVKPRRTRGIEQQRAALLALEEELATIQREMRALRRLIDRVRGTLEDSMALDAPSPREGRMARCHWCGEPLVFVRGKGWVHEDGQLYRGACFCRDRDPPHRSLREGCPTWRDDHCALPEFPEEP